MGEFGDSFLDICTQTIVVQNMTGRDAFGKPTYGAAQTFPGRHSYKMQRVASSGNAVRGEGSEVISASQMWLISSSVPVIGYDDLVYLEGDTGPYAAVVAVQRFNDETGEEQYVKVFLGSAP